MSSTLEFQISTQWNGSGIDHAPVNVKLNKEDGNVLGLEVSAPFFDDPKPEGVRGEPFPCLWDYEVVEAFFLGKNDKYLEVELSPHGQHLVLLLNGRRNKVKDELALEYESKIDMKTMHWTGYARIPEDYFPPDVDKFNAYAIHGTSENRMYESLYPAECGKHLEPDFHRLEYFKPINLNSFIKIRDTDSQIWKDAISIS